MNALSCLGLVGTLLAGGAASAQPICPYTFDPAPVAPDTMVDAVFSIGKVSNNSFEHSGTAYLVDSDHRFLITAAHVIKHANEGEQVDGRSDTFSNEKFQFLVVEKNTERDVALLRLVSGAIPLQVRAFDVRTKIPKFAEALNIVGHPLLSNDFSRSYSRPTYRRYRDVDPLAGTLELEGNTLKGASGSPVFDAYGYVVGTITDNTLDKQLGFARPSHDLSILLDEHYELSSFGKALQLKLQDESITIDQLAQLLRSRPSNASNLDLTKLATDLIESPSEYPERAIDFFSCPLLQSMLHRGLSVPGGIGVVRFLENAKNWAIELGDAALVAGDRNRARLHYSMAYDASMNAVRHLAVTSSAWAERIQCAGVRSNINRPVSLPDGLSTLQQTLVEVPDTKCEEVDPSDRIGRLLADAARAKYSEWQTGDDRKVLVNSRRTAALAVVLANNQLVLGDAYSILGISSVELDDSDEARQAFGLAYLNGVRQPWLDERIEMYDLDLRELLEGEGEHFRDYAEIALFEDPLMSEQPIS